MEKESGDVMIQAYIQKSNIISPLGLTTDENFEAVRNGTTGIQQRKLNGILEEVFVSSIDEDQIVNLFDRLDLPSGAPRIEKLATAAIFPLIEHKKSLANSLLIISTTKGNVEALAQHNSDAADIPTLAKNIASYFGFEKEPMVVSNACVSGLMALSIAKRYLQMGLFDDVYVVAFDEVSAFVQSGFNSFQAVSSEACRPYDQERAGVSLGEAAVACYISTEKRADSIRIAGDANINDANHISGPSRTGEGLFLSIQKALEEAKLTAENMDYIVGHGTATIYNDEMEAIAFNRAGLSTVPLASYKGNYGHTLGASGLLECVLLVEGMRRNVLLPSKGFEELGTSQPIEVLKTERKGTIQFALKTASGFGGTNTALVLSKD